MPSTDDTNNQYPELPKRRECALIPPPARSVFRAGDRQVESAEIGPFGLAAQFRTIRRLSPIRVK